MFIWLKQEKLEKDVAPGSTIPAKMRLAHHLLGLNSRKTVGFFAKLDCETGLKAVDPKIVAKVFSQLQQRDPSKKNKTLQSLLQIPVIQESLKEFPQEAGEPPFEESETQAEEESS